MSAWGSKMGPQAGQRAAGPRLLGRLGQCPFAQLEWPIRQPRDPDSYGCRLLWTGTDPGRVGGETPALRRQQRAIAMPTRPPINNEMVLRAEPSEEKFVAVRPWERGAPPAHEL
jgi:hypothetical protein